MIHNRFGTIFNSAKDDPFIAGSLERLVQNIYAFRTDLLSKSQYSRKDLYKECDYPQTGELNATDYKEMYDRNGIANRVVNYFPNECWQRAPELFESEDVNDVTEFEKVFAELGEQLGGEPSWFASESLGSPIWEALHRVDRLSRIAHFGGILIGIDDRLPLDQPVKGFSDAAPDRSNAGAPIFVLNQNGKPHSKRKLLYLSVFDEMCVSSIEYETAEWSLRYRRPKFYTIDFGAADVVAGSAIPVQRASRAVRVHWSRIVHVADNINSSEIIGTPAMRPVWNNLLDIQKIYGSDAESFWKNCMIRLFFETNPNLGGDVSLDLAGMRDAMWNMENGLQRWMALIGMSAKPVSPQVVDPKSHIESQIDAICIQIETPKRIFMGSERGQLASGQDDSSWNDKVRGRQDGHCTPRICAPFVNRLIAMNVLPQPKDKLRLVWPDPENLQPLERADLAVKKTETLAKYVAGKLQVMIDPMDFYTRFLEIEEEEAKTILENAQESQLEDVDKQAEIQQARIDAGLFPDEGDDGSNSGPNSENKKEEEEEEDEEEDEEEEVRNAFCPTGKGGGRDNSCGRMKVDVRNLKVVKGLGGSTGAKLVRDETTGEQYVMKRGRGEKQLREEFAADQIYQAAGIDVPDKQLVETKKGPVTLATFHAGSRELGSLRGSEREAVRKKVSEGFAADALLSNWDVVGLNDDNILLSQSGQVLRADNGGSLRFRAQGAPKGKAFGNKVGELETMRNLSIAPEAARVFGELSDSQVAGQIEGLLVRRKQILKATPSDLKSTISARLDYMQDWASRVRGTKRVRNESNWVTNAFCPTGKGGGVNPHCSPNTGGGSGASSSGTSFLGANLNEKVSSFKNAIGNKTKFTKTQLEKVASINDGSDNSKVFVPLALNKQQIAAVEASFPDKTVKKINALKYMKGTGGTKKHGDLADPAPLAKPSKSKVGKLPEDWGKVANGSTMTLTPSKTQNKPAIEKWQNDLSSNEKAVIGSWKGTSVHIKDAERGKSSDPSSIANAKVFNSALNKAPKYDGIVYRGERYFEGKNSKRYQSLTKVGSEIEFHASHSASKDPRRGVNFSNAEVSIIMRVKTKSGVDIHHFDGFTKEQEVVLRKNTKYRVVGVAHEVLFTKKLPKLVSGPKGVKRTVVDLEEI